MSNNFKINHKGFIFANLEKVSGYTIEHAIIELVHNSDDARASKVLVIFEKKDNDYYIFIIDNGNGMDYSEITNMNILYKHQETDNDNGHGTFGYGAKGAMLCVGGIWTFLSKKKQNDSICRLVWDVELMKEEVTTNKHIPELDSRCIIISDETGVKSTNIFNEYISKIDSKYGTIAMCKLPHYDDEDEIESFEKKLVKSMETIRFKNNNEECEILFLNRAKNEQAEIEALISFDPLDYRNTIDSRKTKVTIWGKYIKKPNPYPEFYITDKDGTCFKYKSKRKGVPAHFAKTNLPTNPEIPFDKLTLEIALLTGAQVENQKKKLNNKTGVERSLTGIFINRNGNYIYIDSCCWESVLKHMAKDNHNFSAACAPTSYGMFIKGARCVLSYNKTKSSKVFDQVFGSKANKSSFSIESVHDKMKSMLGLLINDIYRKIKKNWRSENIDIRQDPFLETNLHLCNIPQIVSNILKKEGNKKREDARKVAEAKKEAARKEAEAKKEVARKEAEAARKEAEAKKEAARKEAEAKKEAARKEAEAARKESEAKKEAARKAEEARKEAARKAAEELKIKKFIIRTEEEFKKIIYHNMEKVHKDMMNNHLTDPEKKRKLAEINGLLENYISLG